MKKKRKNLKIIKFELLDTPEMAVRKKKKKVK